MRSQQTFPNYISSNSSWWQCSLYSAPALASPTLSSSSLPWPLSLSSSEYSCYQRPRGRPSVISTKCFTQKISLMLDVSIAARMRNTPSVPNKSNQCSDTMNESIWVCWTLPFINIAIRQSLVSNLYLCGGPVTGITVLPLPAALWIMSPFSPSAEFQRQPVNSPEDQPRFYSWSSIIVSLFVCFYLSGMWIQHCRSAHLMADQTCHRILSSPLLYFSYIWFLLLFHRPVVIKRCILCNPLGVTVAPQQPAPSWPNEELVNS